MSIESEMHSTFGSSVKTSRRHFIGGSDARIIMGADEAALIRISHTGRRIGA